MNIYIFDYCTGGIYKVPNVDECSEDLIRSLGFKPSQVEYMCTDKDLEIIELNEQSKESIP